MKKYILFCIVLIILTFCVYCFNFKSKNIIENSKDIYKENIQNNEIKNENMDRDRYLVSARKIFEKLNGSDLLIEDYKCLPPLQGANYNIIQYFLNKKYLFCFSKDEKIVYSYMDCSNKENEDKDNSTKMLDEIACFVKAQPVLHYYNLSNDINEYFIKYKKNRTENNEDVYSCNIIKFLKSKNYICRGPRIYISINPYTGKIEYFGYQPVIVPDSKMKFIDINKAEQYLKEKVEYIKNIDPESLLYIEKFKPEIVIAFPHEKYIIGEDEENIMGTITMSYYDTSSFCWEFVLKDLNGNDIWVWINAENGELYGALPRVFLLEDSFLHTVIP
jgi:hypothetical protein